MSGNTGSQPPGAQGGQPQGGQPTQGGQPAQGGQTAPGMGDIFNRPDTMGQLKRGVAMFAIVALGMGLGVLLLDILDDTTRETSGLLIANSAWVAVPLLAAVLAQTQSGVLSELPDNLVYGTAGFTAAVGAIVFGLLTWLFGEITFDVWADVGDVIETWLAFAIAGAIVAAAIVAVDRNL